MQVKGNPCLTSAPYQGLQMLAKFFVGGARGERCVDCCGRKTMCIIYIIMCIVGVGGCGWICLCEHL